MPPFLSVVMTPFVMKAWILEKQAARGGAMSEFERLEKEVRITGEWWKIWESKEASEHPAQTGCKEAVEIAISELKNVFTAEWFKLHSYDHPFTQSLLYPNPRSLEQVVPLGSAIRVLGGAKSLPSKFSNAIGELQSKEGFFSRDYELEVMAWLKISGYVNMFEEELKRNKSASAPDGKGKEAYFEVKYLDMMSNLQLEADRKLKQLTDIANEKSTSCTIDLGGPTNIGELDQAVKTARNLLNSVKVGDSIITEGKIKIQLRGSIKLISSKNQVRNFKSCTIENYIRPEFHERWRIARDLWRDVWKSANKYPEDLPVIVIINPSRPMVAFSDADFKNWVRDEIFKLASKKSKKMKRVKELWIDVTPFVDIGKMRERLLSSNPFLSLLRVFVKLENPSYTLN